MVSWKHVVRFFFFKNEDFCSKSLELKSKIISSLQYEKMIPSIHSSQGKLVNSSKTGTQNVFWPIFSRYCLHICVLKGRCRKLSKQVTFTCAGETVFACWKDACCYYHQHGDGKASHQDVKGAACHIQLMRPGEKQMFCTELAALWCIEQMLTIS